MTRFFPGVITYAAFGPAAGAAAPSASNRSRPLAEPAFAIATPEKTSDSPLASAIALPVEPEISVPAKKLRVKGKEPNTFALWVRPDADCPSDVPLVSAANTLSNPADVKHGRGVEIRLVDGEIEYRLAKRLPAYSLTVRTVSAAIAPGEWRHVAVTFAGLENVTDAPPSAAAVRIAVDGERAEVELVRCGLFDIGNHVNRVPYRIGTSTEVGGADFRGRLANLRAFGRAVASARLRDEFFADAVPLAVAARVDGDLPPHQAKWLKRAAVEAVGGDLAATLERLREARRERAALVASFPTLMVMS